jgi:glutamate synthase domain-containing protein 3
MFNRITRNEIKIDAAGMYYRDLNAQLKSAVETGISRINIHNVLGQRYIGSNLRSQANIDVYGHPGDDLGAFMSGPMINVYGDTRDNCGNMMRDGCIVVRGSTGDTTGFSLMGGKLLIRDNTGNRAGIHMREFGGKTPVIVIGGTVGDFLGEYMEGGVIILLGLNLAPGKNHCLNSAASRMHGGAIYVRGAVDENTICKEAVITKPHEIEWQVIRENVSKYAYTFSIDTDYLLGVPFVKLFARQYQPT